MLQPLQTVAMAAANSNEIQIFHQHAGALFANLGEEGIQKRRIDGIGWKMALPDGLERWRVTAARG